MEDASLQVTFSSELTPKDADKHLRGLGKTFEKETEKMMKSLYKLALDAAESKVPVHKGSLRDSLHKGHRNSASFYSADGFAIGSNLPYARLQDNAKRWGVKPAWPNVVTLRSWVASKIAPPTEKLDSVTYLVGRKLSMETPKPNNYLEYAAERVRLRMTSYSDQMARNVKVLFR